MQNRVWGGSGIIESVFTKMIKPSFVIEIKKLSWYKKKMVM